MRRLATIQMIQQVEPIPNADALERLRVLGWWVVAKKGDYRPGDKVVYCEIDSLLPERPEFEFLRASSFKPAVVEAGVVLQRAGFRVRTVKLRGQVSQGICFPLSILPSGAPTEVGAEVTADLGIIKYDPPLPQALQGRVKGPFPAFLPKTDETRIQVLESLLERRRGEVFFMTEKLDGTSFTAFLRDGEFGLCSRNQWLDETDRTNMLVRLAEALQLPEKLAAIRDRFGVQPALQGEVVGPGVQGNKYARPFAELHVFNLLDLDQGRLFSRGDFHAALTLVGLTGVPELGELTLNHTVDELVQISIGASTLNPKVQREGIVLRPAVEQFDEELGGRLSFKVINPQFLLKFDE
ncbi:MAG TPA: RNA ligase (ATP) [Pirellulales bacterium]